MTVVAVLADPPREGLVLPELPGRTPLSPAEAADLYEAGLKDLLVAVATSGGDPLVNYRPRNLLPEAHREGPDPEERLRSIVGEALSEVPDADPDAVRYEVQVGSTPAARVGNTVTHLLREEEATSAAVVPPSAPLLGRKEIDSAAMKLRRSSVVLGPSTAGRVAYAGFADTIDFERALAVPAVETLAGRAVDAGHDVDFLSSIPRIDSPGGLASTVALVRARRRADRRVPGFTAAAVEDLGLAVREDEGEAAVVRE